MTIRSRSSRTFRFASLCLCAGLILSAGQTPVMATQSLSPAKEPSSVQLLVSAAVPGSTEGSGVRPEHLVVGAGKSLILELDSSVKRVSMANPSVADAVVISPQQLLINGLVAGSTSLVLWFESGVARYYDLTVEIDTVGLGHHLKAFFPSENIIVGSSKGTLVLNGTVSNPEIGERAAKIAGDYSGNVVNNLTFPEGGRQQIALKIIFAEVDREAIMELSASFARIDPNNPRSINEGLGTTGTPGASGNFIGDPFGPDFNFNDAINLYAFNFSDKISGFITALKTRGDLQILAEPTLIAADGEEASFLAGGEFPIPVAQAGAGFTSVTIIYKKFGISLDFKPAIRDEETIVLRVQPEVSALDFANAVTLSGFRVPALRVRRADTEIELRNGQSFAIAGLYSSDLQQMKKKIPILGDIPLLGYLFRSKNLNKRKTELLVIATPTIVTPNEPGNLPKLPDFEIDFDIEKKKKEKAISELKLKSDKQIAKFLEGFEEPTLIDPSEFSATAPTDGESGEAAEDSSEETSATGFSSFGTGTDAVEVSDVPDPSEDSSDKSPSTAFKGGGDVDAR